MRIKTSREKRILIYKTTVRWILYYILIFFGYIFMNSGSLKKPLVLIPMAICIAVDNDRLASTFTAAVCGFLIDMSCGKLFGYNAVILAAFCILTSLVFEFYLKNRFINILIATAAASFAQGWLDYKFYYEMWKYDDVTIIFRTYTIPVWIYTVISSVFIFLLFKLINHFLMPKEHLTIEEVINNVKR